LKDKGRIMPLSNLNLVVRREEMRLEIVTGLRKQHTIKLKIFCARDEKQRGLAKISMRNSLEMLAEVL